MAGSKVEQSGARAIQAGRTGWRYRRNAHRRSRGFLCATGIACLILASCSKAEADSQSLKVAELERRIETLELSADLARQNIAGLRLNQSTELAPGDDGFGYVSNGATPATISLKGMEAEGSATKVRLQIGNLTSATLHKCWLIIEVRETKDGAFVNGERRDIAGQLKPGTYNNVSIVLPDTKPEQISALRASSITCNSAIMNI